MRRIVLLACACVLFACTSTQSRFAPLGGKVFPPRPESFEIAVFTDAAPERTFERIARLDAHFEKTAFVKSTFHEALVELKRQARLAGADALIEIHEQRSSVGETRIYHVTATAIRYEP